MHPSWVRFGQAVEGHLDGRSWAGREPDHVLGEELGRSLAGAHVDDRRPVGLQENAGQPFLAGIEKLITKIFLNPLRRYRR